MKNFNWKCKELVSKGLKSFSLMTLFAVFFFAFSMNVQAQNSVSSAGGNILSPQHPTAAFAKVIGITVHPLGSWNQNVVLAELRARLDATDKNSSNPIDRFKVLYYTQTIEEIESLDIAPQITTIESMRVSRNKLGNPPSVSDSWLRSFYNDLVSNF